MKVIFSRKGFDSSYGGYPSPILPDNSLISIPIPSMRFLQKKTNGKEKLQYFDGSSYVPTQYKDLKIPPYIRESLFAQNLNLENYRDLLLQLLPKTQIKENINSKTQWFDRTVPWYCHLDPDILPEVLPREKKWRSIFGQIKSAQRHLEKQNVKQNDLFLFFGWFRKTKIVEKSSGVKLTYDPADPQGTHIIFGYLQIEETLKKKDYLKIQSWMKPHPHLGKGLWNAPHNTLYIARSTLSWNRNYAGAGYFKFHKDLVLTETNTKINPKKNRSIWKYSFLPFGTEITYHSSDSWIEKNNERGEKIHYFKSADRGQEFIVDNCLELENTIRKWNFFNQK